MSNFDKAVEYVLSNETFHNKTGVVSLYEDAATGEVSNWGISLKWLIGIDPEATADTVRGLSRDAAIDLYHVHWWKALKLDLIENPHVAAKVMDMCVNCGPVTAIKMLQESLNEPMGESDTPLAVDGVMGVKTAEAIAMDCHVGLGEYGLLASLASVLEDHYRAIAEKNPALAKNLGTWLKRAEKLPA